MAVRTVICIDNSGSTRGCDRYFRKVNEILHGEQDLVVITWNSTALIVDPETRHFDSGGGTKPSEFLNIIEDFDYDYNLVITTDGEIFDDELFHCKTIIDSTDVLTRIKAFKIYFIGDENRMNLKISSLFNTVKGEKAIFINDDEAIQVRDIDLGLIQKLTYQDFDNEKSIIASVLSMIQTFPNKKNEIRAEICKLSNRIIAKDLTDGSIKEFYETNDIDGCISYVKKIDDTNKKKFQQVINKILNLFDARDCYSLSHLSNTNELKGEDIEVEENDDDEEDEEMSEDDLICDILYKKIEYLCILVKMIPDEESTNIDKFAIFPDHLSKKYSINPFMILKDKEAIERIVRRVEPQKLDLLSYNNLKKHSGEVNSPFSRDNIKGVFIFHGDDNEPGNYKKIFKNNNRTLSFIFGENSKLPGNKALWNVLFLYILIKHHGEWKQHETKLKEEIVFICKNVRSFVTFSPILNPSIKENLDVCLWYIVRVAHRAFENSHSNVLRSIEGSEDLLEFYSYIFGDQDLTELRIQVKKWVCWKYLVRNRSDWKIKLDVISHIQNFETINGSKVFFSGKSNTNMFGVDPNEVIKLYTLLKQCRNPTLTDDLNQPIEGMYKTIEIPDETDKDLDHVLICVSTCNPLVVCPITKQHWKNCLQITVEKINIEKYSYIRLFKRFCIKYNRYPEDENELLVFHSDTYNKKHEDFIVYALNTREFLRLVMMKFAEVMKEHDVKTYLKLSKLYCEETERQKMESICNKCTFHGEKAEH